MNPKIIYFVLGLILITVLNITMNSTDLFSILLVSTLYLIFIKSFSHIKYNKKTNNQLVPIITIIILISLIYLAISYCIGSIFFTDIKSIFMAMGASIFIYPTIKVIKNYLDNNKQKKQSVIINLIYYLINIISLVVLILLYHFINLDINTFGIILYLSNYVALLIILITQRKIFKFKKINIKELKPILATNIRERLIILSNIAYYYLSLIFLYFSLTHKYLYDYSVVSTLLIDVYLYCYYIVVFIAIIFYPKKLEDNINTTYIKVISKMLPITILISILAGPILLVLFNHNTNAYIFTLLVFEAIILVMYNIAMNLLKDKKNFNIVLITGLLIKCITTIPLINSLYRMGYSMVYGDIISTIISLAIPVIIAIIYFNNKQKVSFDNYFTSILNIIYENIILCLILILLQLIIPLTTNNRLVALGVIVIYTIIYLVFNYIKRKLRRTKWKKLSFYS